jgi:hypothetical protein
MIQIEEFKHDISRELHSRERHWIEQLKATLNKYIPTRTTAEYRQDNKEVIAEKKKHAYQNNKEVILEQHKQAYQNNKEVILEQHKQYYQNNKEVRLEKQKQYYQNNKEVIAEKRKHDYQNNKEVRLEKQKQEYICECGATICIASKSRHNKSAKHLAWAAALPTVSDSSVCV